MPVGLADGRGLLPSFERVARTAKCVAFFRNRRLACGCERRTPERTWTWCWSRGSVRGGELGARGWARSALSTSSPGCPRCPGEGCVRSASIPSLRYALRQCRIVSARTPRSLPAAGPGTSPPPRAAAHAPDPPQQAGASAQVPPGPHAPHHSTPASLSAAYLSARLSSWVCGSR